jgi:uncharacterized membrane protein YraQ (UPF0718 family)
VIELTASIVALAVGPLIYWGCRRYGGALAGLDGFIFISMGGLILIDVLPTVVEHGGWASFAFVAAGLVGPTLLEHGFRGASGHTHFAALMLGLVGLGLHAAFDGVFLGGGTAIEDHHGHGHAMSSLPVAIILHRVPVGLTVWWLMRRNYGVFAAIAVLGLIALSTIGGNLLGDVLADGASSVGMAWFQAFVAGSLLHVVIHRPHQDEGDCGGCGPVPGSERLYAGIGGVLGLGLLAPFLPSVEFSSGHEHAAEHAEGFLDTFLSLSFESAPALLLGYFMAGVLGAFLPVSSIRWLGRGRAWNQALRGVTLGLPLPVCSCGVVPLYRTLVERGAPATAAMAFLVATPELGIDAVLLSIPLLGTEFTIARVVAAGLLALVVGMLVGRITSQRPHTEPAQGGSADAASEPRFANRARNALRLGFGELIDHTGPWILLGLVVAALTKPLLDESDLSSVPDTLQVLLFAALGIPLYVCASGATPLVAILILGGISPGAALAFLLTGPATNVVTFGVLRSLHGRRIALAFCVAMLVLSVTIGVGANLVFRGLHLSAGGEIHHESASTLSSVCLAVLALIFLASFVRRGPRQFVGEIASGLDIHPSSDDEPSQPSQPSQPSSDSDPSHDNCCH